jgi:phospholipid/cholesterol/gamma-HCH transport system substrate-binding protein
MSDDLPAAPPSRTRDQALWVGLFLLLAISVTVILLYTLTDAAMFRGRYIVSTQVPDAGGIRRGDPVQMRGVNIGRVMSFVISAPSDPAGAKVTLRLEIEGQYKVPKDSRVELRSAGPLGGMIANIVPGKSIEMVGYGDSLAGSAEEPLGSAVQRLTARADKVFDRVDALMSEAFVGDIHGSGAEMRAMLKSLHETTREQRGELKALEASFKRNSENLEKVTSAPELERSVKRLDTITETGQKMVESFNRSADNAEKMMARLERGEGSLGKLSKDEQLYKEMNDAVASMRHSASEISELVADIKKNPKKYISLKVF